MDAGPRIFGRCQPTRSRILLALAGCASVGLSIAFAFGFTTLIGFKLNPVINGAISLQSMQLECRHLQVGCPTLSVPLWVCACITLLSPQS